jgi:hypothetical protein
VEEADEELLATTVEVEPLPPALPVVPFVEVTVHAAAAAIDPTRRRNFDRSIFIHVLPEREPPVHKDARYLSV